MVYQIRVNSIVSFGLIPVQALEHHYKPCKPENPLSFS